MAARKEQNEPAAKASVNMDELRELIALLRENGLAELELEREDFRVRLRREGANAHAPNVAPGPAPIPVPMIDPVVRAPESAAPPAAAAGLQVENAAGTGALQGLQGADITLTLAAVLERGGKLDARRVLAQSRIDRAWQWRETEHGPLT